MRVSALRQIDLGARYVQEAQRVTAERASFQDVDDVVRNGRNTSGGGWRRTQGAEWNECGHRDSARFRIPGVAEVAKRPVPNLVERGHRRRSDRLAGRHVAMLDERVDERSVLRQTVVEVGPR